MRLEHSGKASQTLWGTDRNTLGNVSFPRVLRMVRQYV